MSHKTKDNMDQSMNQELVQSFDSIYKEYKSMIYSYVFRLTRNENETEDLFQETWFRVAKHIHRITEKQTIKAWIFTIATNLFRDSLRKKKIRQLFWQKKDILMSMATKSNNINRSVKEDPAKSFELKETGRAIIKALEKLPEKLRSVFVLKEIESFTYSEISTILNLSEGTAKSRMHRAVKKLKQELAFLSVSFCSNQRGLK